MSPASKSQPRRNRKPLQSRIKRADYGIDAPKVARNFFVIGIAGCVLGTILAKFGSGRLPNWLVSFYGACLGIGGCFVLQGVIMIWGSKVGKLRLRDKMIDSVSWRGDEQVLDVGCGHGLMLIGAAKGLTTGHAIGIDIWQQEDQASNSSRATQENALREGVADRVELRDSDNNGIWQPPLKSNSRNASLGHRGKMEMETNSNQATAHGLRLMICRRLRSCCTSPLF